MTFFISRILINAMKIHEKFHFIHPLINSIAALSVGVPTRDMNTIDFQVSLELLGYLATDDFFYSFL